MIVKVVSSEEFYLLIVYSWLALLFRLDFKQSK